MAIYAYGMPDDDKLVSFVYQSLTDANDPISRYMYSRFDNCDLNRLKNIASDKRNGAENESWHYSHRLLHVKPDDWIMHINIPDYGKVTAAQVNSKYFYQGVLPDNQSDGRHCFHVKNVFTFDRNDVRVHPRLRARLKLMGHLWEIKNCADEFAQTKDLLENKRIDEVNESVHLNRQANEVFADLKNIIQANNPGKDLEVFLAKIFRQIPDVTEVVENGFGWRSDNGADLIVRYRKDLLEDCEFQRTMVIQVKSYEGEHWETNAVEQLKNAIVAYNATDAVLMTTAEAANTLHTAINQLAACMKKENVAVHLIAGNDFVRFVLKYGMNILLGA